MNTLIVWSNQEETKLYLIPNSEIDKGREKLLKKAAGVWVNVGTGDDQGAQFISNALSPKAESCLGGDPSDYCIWKDREISLKDASKPGQNIDRVITSGFWL